MKRLAFRVVASLFLSLLALETCANAAEQWTRVQSEHFVVVGNASEREIREVATRLEQYRSVFARLFSGSQTSHTVPTTVLVFKNDDAFRPFRPLYRGRVSDVAGYFQPGRELNYIAVSAERKGDRAFGTVFHEFAHLFIDDNLRGLPLCINEGLAEYFSTVKISGDGKRLTLGSVSPQRIRLLNQKQLLPLTTLLATDYSSDYYNEGSQRSVFYAQSWAVVHYLLHRTGDDGLDRLSRLITKLSSGASIDAGLKDAFGLSISEIEKNVKAYLRTFAFSTRDVEFDPQLAFATAMRSAQISDSDAEAYFGDLLLHLNRYDEAETYLKKSLALDPHQAMAQASLGMLRVKQERITEAIEILRRAAKADSQNPVTQYYFAYALSREGMGWQDSVRGYSPVAADEMRAALNRAIELSPKFIEAYRLYGFLALVRNEELERALSMLTHALKISPGRQDINFLLAQIHLRGMNFEAARKDLEPILQRGWDGKLREQAKNLMEEIAYAESGRDTRIPVEESANDRATLLNSLSQEQAHAVKPRLAKRFNGERVRGVLTNIECLDNGVVLSVTVADRRWQLFAPELRSVFFVTYVTGLERTVTCGARASQIPIVLTYIAPAEPRAKFDGRAIAVEFVPDDIDIEP